MTYRNMCLHLISLYDGLVIQVLDQQIIFTFVLTMHLVSLTYSSCLGYVLILLINEHAESLFTSYIFASLS